MQPLSREVPYGEYTDPTGLTYLRARYYDPATGQFLTIDPAIASTRSPCTYVAGDPLNNTDPTGLCWGPKWACRAASAAAGAVVNGANAVGSAVNRALPVIHTIANTVAGIAALCAVVTSETVIGGVTCGTIAVVAGGVSATTGAALYAEGRESGSGLALDVAGFALAGVGSLAEAGAAATEAFGAASEGASALARAWAEFVGATSSALGRFSRGLAAEGFGLSAFTVVCPP